MQSEKPKINSEKFSLHNKSLFEQNYINATQENILASKFEFIEEDKKKVRRFKNTTSKPFSAKY